MAGFVIHLAVAQEYAKRNKIENIEEFLRGSIEPDLQDKSISHYFGKDRKSRYTRIFR